MRASTRVVAWIWIVGAVASPIISMVEVRDDPGQFAGAMVGGVIAAIVFISVAQALLRGSKAAWWALLSISCLFSALAVYTIHSTQSSLTARPLGLDYYVRVLIVVCTILALLADRPSRWRKQEIEGETNA
ncbi:MAG TPA: hypothetical protein VFI02_01010 [Armatimonadota bacterium]|nr:hypothetical protein [Armatimonadota bacterium]